MTLAVTAVAKVTSKPVAYEHGGVKLEGWLAYDDEKAAADKLAPGVLVLPEWWGLTDYPKSRAEQLAKLGYVAFAADMYGAGVTTADPKKAGELAALFYGAFLVYVRISQGTPSPGFTTVAALVALTSGIQMMMLGVLGEYLWRALDAARGRPAFVVEKTIEPPHA
jgi:hypothetical protein